MQLLLDLVNAIQEPDARLDVSALPQIDGKRDQRANGRQKGRRGKWERAIPNDKSEQTGPGCRDGRYKAEQLKADLICFSNVEPCLLVEGDQVRWRRFVRHGR